VVGNRDVVSGLKLSSRLMRPFLFSTHVRAALEAMRQYPNQSLEAERKKISHATAQASSFMETLNLEKAGLDSVPFVWARLPKRSPSARAAIRLLKRNRILVVPGSAFGEVGEGYLRLSLTVETEAYQQATKRLRKRRHAPEKDEIE
jgi:LL-diaminopimelate aminotransferase